MRMDVCVHVGTQARMHAPMYIQPDRLIAHLDSRGNALDSRQNALDSRGNALDSRGNALDSNLG